MTRRDGVNVQNIPIRTELGRAIRAAFQPEEQLVLADYAELETKILARQRERQAEPYGSRED